MHLKNILLNSKKLALTFKTILFLFLTLTPFFSLNGLTIEEKKASLISGRSTGDLSKDMQRFLMQVNAEVKDQTMLMRELYQEVRDLYKNNAPLEEYQNLLNQINQVKDNIAILQESWQKMASDNNQEEEYALWHLPNTTIGELVIDYGSQDYVYLMSEEIEEIGLSINSNIPIPRSSWTEMLQMILQQNGIGIKQLNPLLRQLYLLKEDLSTIELITNNPADLEIYVNEARIAFLLSPKPEEIKRIWFFLEKFVNPNNSEVQILGRDILIIAPVYEVRELLKLYKFVEINNGNLEYKIVPLHRVAADEMAIVLSSIFEQLNEDSEPPAPREFPNKVNPNLNIKTNTNSNSNSRQKNYKGANGLKVVTLASVAQALFLIGTPDEIRKAQDIIDQVESEVGEAREKVVYTYQAKHTDSAELADILDRVYNMMASSGPGIVMESNARTEEKSESGNASSNSKSNSKSDATTNLNLNDDNMLLAPEMIYNPGFFNDGSYIINSDLIQPGSSPQGNPDPNRNRTNFIVDIKTGSIVMVVEAVFLPKLKELLRKLDVPTKAVQIEVLLFEKQTDANSIFGLNLLRLGDKASNTDASSLTFNDIIPVSGPANIGNRGILEFTLSRMCNAGMAAYDIAYRFLLTRDDVTINSNPSVVAINQTTATIEIKEQISVNTGTLLIDSTGGAIPNNQFVREEYGITIKVTPTVHMRDYADHSDENDTNYVTLQSDITFDTIKPSTVDRPDVTRRHIVNETRIADGQTVIIGGLRRKETHDHKESIPFLGELPGIGKLFSETIMEDNTREMFIFLTPKIIVDPAEDLERIKYEQMCRRPGDIPAFLSRLERAREREKNCLFEGYLTMVLGRKPPPVYCPPGEFNGRCW